MILSDLRTCILTYFLWWVSQYSFIGGSPTAYTCILLMKGFIGEEKNVHGKSLVQNENDPK